MTNTDEKIREDIAGMDKQTDLQRVKDELENFREFLPDALVEIEFQTRTVTFMSRMAKILFGYNPDHSDGYLAAEDLFATEEEFDRAVDITKYYALQSIQNKEPYERTGRQELVEFQMQDETGRTFPAETQGSLVLDARGIPYAVRIVVRDISKRKELENEREALVNELEKALEQVKTLQGLIPICSSCHKIRDDNGFWQRLEEYIEAHSEAEFSHGICPDCMKTLYPRVSKNSE